MTSSTAVEEQHSPYSCWISLECSGLRFTFVSRSYGAGYLEAIVPEIEWRPFVWALTWGAATSVLLSQIPIAGSPHLTGLQNTSLAKHVVNVSLPEEGFS